MFSREPDKLILIGAGYHGTELYSYILQLRKTGIAPEFLGCIDESKQPGPWETTHILGTFEDLRLLVESHPSQSFGYITATGDNTVRRKLVESVDRQCLSNLFPWSLLHPLAVIGQDIELGCGTLLAPAAILTTHVRVGNHCILNVKSSLSHDCTVGDFVNINPSATVCGNVRVGEGAYIGAGSTIIDEISIGANSIVGAGAVVVHDVPPNVTVVGVPARIIKHHRT